MDHGGLQHHSRPFSKNSSLSPNRTGSKHLEPRTTPYRSKHKEIPLPSPQQSSHPLNPSTPTTHTSSSGESQPTNSLHTKANPPAWEYFHPPATSTSPPNPQPPQPPMPTNFPLQTPTMLPAPPPPQPTTPAPRRSTRTRKPSTRLVCALAPERSPSPPRLPLINDEPPEPWPPRAEDLPPSLHHLLPALAVVALPASAKPASKRALKQVPTPSRTPSVGSNAGSESASGASSPETPAVARWSERSVWRSEPCAESAERESLAREGEVRDEWVRNKELREAQRRRWGVQDWVEKRKLQVMLGEFRMREREREGAGEECGREEEKEAEKETEREKKKPRRK